MTKRLMNNCRGMTLIEVLVAFVVLSVTLGVIMQIFSGGLRNGRVAEAYSRAIFLAESKLASAGVERVLVPGEEGGQVGPDLNWRVAVYPYDDGSGQDMQMMPVRLYQVRSQVSWRENGRDRLVELMTLRLAPKQ